MKLWTQNDDITVEDISARRKKNALFFEEQFRILFKVRYNCSRNISIKFSYANPVHRSRSKCFLILDKN